jgi:hypothetical protein
MSDKTAVRPKVASIAAYGALAVSAVWLMWTAADMMYLAGWYDAQKAGVFKPPYLAFTLCLFVLGIGCLAAVRGMRLFATVTAVLVMAFVQALWFGTVA